MLRVAAAGLYCEQGDFYIDPWNVVPRAIITHAHSDHARSGCRQYLASDEGRHVLQHRLGPQAKIETLPYGASTYLNGVRVSFHPAGHVLGSAQIRLEYRGEIWCVSGDYKIEADPTCTPFEPVRCHTFITESTFGLPIYRWPAAEIVQRQIETWCTANQAAGRPSVLYAYSLGKAQRLLSMLADVPGPILTDDPVEKLVQAYRTTGIALPATQAASATDPTFPWQHAVLIATPGSAALALPQFSTAATAHASGWMAVQSQRRRRACDQAFTLSDHCDWPGLLQAIAATGAERVLVTHGYAAALARYLREQGLAAEPLPTRFQGEETDLMAPEPVPVATPRMVKRKQPPAAPVRLRQGMLFATHAEEEVAP